MLQKKKLDGTCTQVRILMVTRVRSRWSEKAYINVKDLPRRGIKNQKKQKEERITVAPSAV